ncbi:hypothetical protein [Mangrovibacterium marinum]|uniref:Cytochrome b561-like protein n=1 Tax=Mangrovibacterium marinum TaxID=1639118 RepID=A0A2T5C5R2_9BACT|nr:hypothetical protein [Mangrovibacterium marinum]PTN10245.1 hypothetical protein C8N47_102230 [Mangrovibacterium marinum]
MDHLYTGFLHLHNTLRWIILLAALVTLLKYFIGWFGQQKWDKSANILGAVFTGLMDLQLLTGIALYAFLSPITKAAFQDFGVAMKNADLRFYAVEHLVMMLVAIVLVHIGRIKSKRAQHSKTKYSVGLLFFGIAYIIILAGIPWQRVIG